MGAGAGAGAGVGAGAGAAVILAPGAGAVAASAASPASAVGERSFDRKACSSSSAAALSAEADCSRLSTEGRRSGDTDAHAAHADVGVDGDALDGDSLGAFDPLDTLDGDGLDRDACACGEEGRATTIVARRTRRSTVTAWSCRDCGHTRPRVSPGWEGGQVERDGG